MSAVVDTRELTQRDAPGEPYLTFHLAEQEYGVLLRCVREIVPLSPITQVPTLNSCMRGVTNLRGRVLPVVDLRDRLGLAVTPDHPRKCIIVTDLRPDKRDCPASLLVDSVAGLSRFCPEHVTETTQLGVGPEARFLYGVARRDPCITFLLDLEAVLASVGLA